MFDLSGVSLAASEEHMGAWGRAWESSLELRKVSLCALGAEERLFLFLEPWPSVPPLMIKGNYLSAQTHGG